MPFQTSPEIDFSSVGLITDVPAHAVPAGGWSNCMDVRCKDGSVQGVNSFIDYDNSGSVVLFPSATNAIIAGGKCIAITQFTPAGGDFLILAYIVKGTDDNGYVILYDTDPSNSSPYNNITNQTHIFKFDDKSPPQIFMFNEMLVVNPAYDEQPMVVDPLVSAGSLVPVPNWVIYPKTHSTASDVTAGNLTDYYGNSVTEEGQVMTAATAVARILRPYKNRLIAMNIVDDNITAAKGDDKEYPIDLLWSSHITTLQSFSGVEWTASFTNTAGDAFLTDTPGKIIDGGQLGEFFIAYKSDSVVRVAETGDNFILRFDSIFEDDGIYSSRCFVNIGNAQHLVIGNYGVYLHDGQSQKQDIAGGLFQDVMYALVDPTKRDRSFCFQQTRDKEVWFCLRSKESSGDGCDQAFVFNYATSKLHRRSLPDLTDIYETEINGELSIFASKSTAGSDHQVLSNTTFVSGGFFEKVDDNFTMNGVVKQVNRVHVNSSNGLKLSIVGLK